MENKDSTVLYQGPKDTLSILKDIFSLGLTEPTSIAIKTGKNKGTILNAMHDLRILCLVDENTRPFDEAKNIIYNRNSKETLKELFSNVNGYKKAIEEISHETNLTPLKTGQIFCYHANARATKESSIKQIGRLYLRWLRYLDIITKKSGENN